MLKIDVHNHFYPEAYIAAVRRDSAVASITVDDAGVMRIHYPGDYSVIVPAHRDAELRIGDMERAGVDMQVLSLTVPGVHFEPEAQGIRLAQVTNEAFAEIVQRYPERYRAFATLPTQTPDEAARELERAVRELGLSGAMVFSNLGGLPLDDPRFWPIYAAAEDLEVPLLIHPTTPASAAGFEELRLVPLLGFPFDMTLAATRLVLGGVLERFPRLILILGQLGGALPLLAERVERGYAIYPELSGSLQRSPSEYFRMMYYDTVPYGQLGIPLTYDFAGPERIVLASDHPHQIGNLQECATVIESMDIPAEHKALMLGGNMARLLRLTD